MIFLFFLTLFISLEGMQSPNSSAPTTRKATTQRAKRVPYRKKLNNIEHILDFEPEIKQALVRINEVKPALTFYANQGQFILPKSSSPIPTVPTRPQQPCPQPIPYAFPPRKKLPSIEQTFTPEISDPALWKKKFEEFTVGLEASSEAYLVKQTVVLSPLENTQRRENTYTYPS